MGYIIIGLAAAGLMVLPCGKLYAIVQSRKNIAKFSDRKFMTRYNVTLRIISFSLCLIAIILALVCANN